MTTLQDDPRTYANTTGMLKMPARTDPDFTTGQPVAEDPGLVGAMWPQRKKGTGAGDFVLMDALEPSRRYALASANPPKLDPAGINSTSALSFGDGTAELPGSIEGNGSLRFSDVPLLGSEGTIAFVSRTYDVAGRGTLVATSPTAGGLFLSITNAGYFQLQVGGFGQVLRRDVDLRNGAAVMHTVTWRRDPDPAYSIFNYYVGKALWAGGSNFRVATAVNGGRPVIGVSGDPGATLTSPLARTFLGEIYFGNEDLSVVTKTARLELIHARLNWRHSLGLA